MPNPFTSPSSSPLANRLAQGYVADLYRAAIGPRSQEYYLHHFLKFDADGKTSATWHWAAYWSTLNWLIFRRMWAWAMGYGALLVMVALAIFGVGKLAFNYSDGTGVLLFLLFLSLAFVLPGIYANALFYKNCNDRINKVLQETPDVPSACEVLQSQASDGKRAFKVALGNLAVLSLGAGVASFMLNPPDTGQLLAQSARSKPSSGSMTVEMLPVATSAPSPKTSESPALAPAPVLAPAAADPPKPDSPFAKPALAMTNAESASKADEIASPALPAPERITSPAKIEELVTKAMQPATPTEKLAADAVVAQAKVSEAPAPAKPALPVMPAKPEKPVVAEGKMARALEPAQAKPKADGVSPAVPGAVGAAATASEAKASEPKSEVAKPAAPAKSQAVKENSSPGKTAAPAKPQGTEASNQAKTTEGKAKKVWFVQAGAFAQVGNAQNVSSRLDEAGFKSITEPLGTSPAPLTRVRVGPFESKAEAEQAMQKIKAMDLPAVLFRE